MGKKTLPPVRETEQTIRVGKSDLTVCPNCKKEFGDSKFCSECGTPRTVKNVYHLPIDKPISAEDFEKSANEWLAQNPYIFDCTFDLKTTTPAIQFNGTHKTLVSSASFSFQVADEPQNFQYGVAYLYQFRMMGKYGYNNATQIEEWEANNTDLTAIMTKAGGWHEVSGNNGSYAEFYNFVLFQKDK